jgi:hypothetical protein
LFSRHHCRGVASCNCAGSCDCAGSYDCAGSCDCRGRRHCHGGLLARLRARRAARCCGPRPTCCQPVPTCCGTIVSEPAAEPEAANYDAVPEAPTAPGDSA